MGCDIHIYVEYKRHIDSVEQWVSGDYYKVNPYYGTCESESEYEVVEIYNGRWYELFSVLADVRNYSDNIPLSQPKGVPEDSCKQIKAMYEYWDCDAHSASYFTLKELMENREKYMTTKRSGMLSPKQLEELKNGIKPNSWCQSTNQKDFEYAEWEDDSDVLGAIVKPLITRAKELFSIYDFYKEQEAKEKIDEISDKIRVVFWFDN